MASKVDHYLVFSKIFFVEFYFTNDSPFKESIIIIYSSNGFEPLSCAILLDSVCFVRMACIDWIPRRRGGSLC